jgi:hypothetical protein
MCCRVMTGSCKADVMNQDGVTQSERYLYEKTEGDPTIPDAIFPLVDLPTTLWSGLS